VKTPRIYADFQNADSQGRLRLNCIGTTKDLARENVVLQQGSVLTLYSDDADAEGNADDLEVTGVVLLVSSAFSEANPLETYHGRADESSSSCLKSHDVR